MNKKILTVAFMAVMGVGVAFAGPKPPPQGNGHLGGHRPPAVQQPSKQQPPKAQSNKRHHDNDHKKESFWGKGGENFWPGFIGGLVGAILAPDPEPVVIEQPVYVTQRVWVDGHYEYQQVRVN